jgi:hypothetical protein
MDNNQPDFSPHSRANPHYLQAVWDFTLKIQQGQVFFDAVFVKIAKDGLGRLKKSSCP